MALESISDVQPIVIAKEQPNFVQTPYVRDIIKRSTTYMQAGFPVHFSGPAGSGKTTLAMYVAAQLGRPVILVHGDEELGTGDLVGGEYGYRMKKLVDNFIHSVMKTEEDVAVRWVDNRLTVACKYGFTLIYDEFTRSRPEANNVLLSVMEEKILDVPAGRGEEGHLKVHPDFSAIFTSNPVEYTGVHKAQDALRDRMITIRLSHYDREAEIAITQVKSGTSHTDAERIVDVIRGIREDKGSEFPSVRACIMIGKILNLCNARPVASDEIFVRTCLDVLNLEDRHSSREDIKVGESKEMVMGLIKKYCKSTSQKGKGIS